MLAAAVSGRTHALSLTHSPSHRPLPGKKGAKLTTQIPSAQFILESFGHAATLNNPNASRFGRYVEVQYGDKSKLVGCKSLLYHLDASRTSGPPHGERNFHVFHHLLAGATPEEAAHLKLDPSHHHHHQGGFRYLSGLAYPSPNRADAAKFAQLKEAFRLLAFPKRAVSSICQLLAAILHLGQLDFVGQPTEDAAAVANWDVLEHVAALLGVDPEALQSALATKTWVRGHDRVSALLDEEGAARNRDALAQALYRLLFSWLGDFLNAKLSRDDFQSFVSVLDFPGIQNGGGASRPNGLHELCFNLANERLRAFTTQQIFEKQKNELEQEEVSRFLPGFHAEHLDHSDTTRILTTRPGGLVHIIDDQTSRRGKTDTSMLAAMGKRWENHASFGWSPGNEQLGRVGSFVISHYDGQVTYSAENFIEDNKASVSTDFVQLFGGTLVDVAGPIGSKPTRELSGGSSVPFIQELFDREAQEAAEAANNGGGLKPKSTLRARPSTRRKAKAAEADEPGAEGDNPFDQVAALKRKQSNRAPPDARTELGSFNDDFSLLLDTMAEVGAKDSPYARVLYQHLMLLLLSRTGYGTYSASSRTRQACPTNATCGSSATNSAPWAWPRSRADFKSNGPSI